MFLPTTKQAVSKRLKSICNVLIMSVTYFSLSVISAFEKVRRNNFEKHGEWIGKMDIRQNYGNLPGSQRSMHSYIL